MHTKNMLRRKIQTAAHLAFILPEKFKKYQHASTIVPARISGNQPIYPGIRIRFRAILF